MYKRAACAVPFLAFLVACGPRIMNYTYLDRVEYPPRAEDAFIEVHEAPHINEFESERAYDVLARFRVKQQAYVSSGLIETAREKARAVGGDAIVYATGAGTEFEGSDFLDLDRGTVWVIRYHE